jgi:hypothetical protein
VPPAATPEEIIEEEAPVEMVPEQEALVAHEVILADAEPLQHDHEGLRGGPAEDGEWSI